MLSRDEILEVIDGLYDARVRGAKGELPQFWAECANFQISGYETALFDVPLQCDEPVTSISKLIDRFTFSDLIRLDAVVEGNRAVVRWELTVKVEGKEPVRTRLLDLVEVNDERKISSFVQFADSALVAKLVE